MIQLTKELVLTADEHCYIVGKPRESRGNGVELRNPRYYTTVAQASLHQSGSRGADEGMTSDELEDLCAGLHKEDLLELLLLIRLLRFVPEFREELHALAAPGERIPPPPVVETLIEKYKGRLYHQRKEETL